MADRILKLTNGKEINLSNFLGEVKEKDFLGQNKKIFNIFDANKDKTIDFEESYYIGNILLDFISRFDGEEKDLSENEINLLKSSMPELKDLKNEEITSFIAKLYETIQLKNTSKFTSEYLNDYAVNNLNMVEEVSEGGVFDKLGWMISQYFDEKPINIEEYESKVKHTQTKAKHLLKAKDLGLNLYNDVYKTYTNKEFSVEEAQKFEQKALRFLQVRELKHKKEQLKKDLSRVKRAYEQEETANKIAHPLSRANAMPKLDWRTEFGNAVSNFFGNDEKLKEIMLKEMAPNFSTNASKKEIYTILNNFQKMVDELYTNTLADEKYETIEKEYKEAFKLIYGEEEISDEIYEKISSSLQIGGLAQIGLVITLQIVLTKLTAGTATVALEALKAKYGLTAVQNAVRLLSATNTVALDYGVKVLNELTSKNGLSEKDINTMVLKV